MNNYKNSLKAFTILELVMAMLLMGLIVSMGYMGWRVFTQHFNKLNNDSAHANSFMLLNTAFANDMDRSSKIFLTESGLSFQIDNYLVDYYAVAEKFIRVENKEAGEKIDTFYVHLANQEVRMNNIVQDSLGAFIDHIMLDLAFGKDTLSLTIPKHYDATSLLTH